MEKVEISIVVPCYNEEESLPLFYNEAISKLATLNKEWEIIFVNDGSKDKTQDIIEELCDKDKRIKGICFSRNFGQQAALLCGLKHAKGNAVIDMDCDLQDPFDVALEMIKKWEDGFEVVHGVRKNRENESGFKKSTAKWFYKIFRKTTKLDMPLNSGDFKLFDRKVVDAIIKMKEHSRLLRAQATWVGFKQTSIEFDRPGRVAGQTKYNLKKMMKLAKDGFVPNTYAPLHVSAIMGIVLLILSLITFIVLIILSCLKVPSVNIVSYIFPTLTTLTSILLISHSLSNVYLAAIYEESKNRPIYIISKTKNIDNE